MDAGALSVMPIYPRRAIGRGGIALPHRRLPRW